MTPRLDVELFEIVPVNTGTVLLRLEGRWPAEAREPLPMPTLVADNGRRSHRLAALPGPDATAPQAGPDAPLWRASYPMPAELLHDTRIVFALDAGRGVIVDLPAPAPRGQGRRFSRSSGAELAHERTLRAQAERLAVERRRSLRDAEAELDRERAARAAETMRADIAESDLARVGAELESQQDHARADAAQQARDADVAAGALAVAQARVRELDEALAAQRRRALEAESTAQTAAADDEARRAQERAHAADALAAQRALAEEATRAQIAAQTQAREHIARAVDLEIARDELRTQLERERERVRQLQSREVAEETIEERRRSREQQARSETDAHRLRELTAELVTLAEERAHLQGELADAHERIAALEAAAAARPAVAPEPVRPVDAIADAVALAASLPAAAPAPGPVVRASDRRPVPGAAASPALDAEPEPESARPALVAQPLPTATIARPAQDEFPAERDPADPGAQDGTGPVADARDTAQPATEPEAQPAPGADPEPAPSTAVAVFGPFGDAGGPGDAEDADAAPERRERSGAGAASELVPSTARSFDPDREPSAPHRPPRWDTDDYDLSFDLPAQRPPAGRRSARQREADAALDLAADDPRGRRPARGAGRPRADVQPYDPRVVTRRAIALGVIVAALVLVVLNVSGVLGVAALGAP